MASTFSVKSLAIGLLASQVSLCDGAVINPRDAVPAGYVAAPYYPAPYGGWVSDWSDSYRKAKLILMFDFTNTHVGRCVGNSGSIPRLGIPSLCLADSATGVRLADNVTVFPAGITTGATFSKDLMYARAVAMGKEFRGKGANVFLGPMVGPMGRKPRGGRNWEGFGTDPALNGHAAYLTVKGVQEQGVIATVKHLIGNEQEIARMYTPLWEGYSANIDDRTLHELYLYPFAMALRAGPGSVMTAYNAVNGSACSQNSYLINGILKDELGFQGFVMSDWLSHMSGVGSALAGLDFDAPGDQQIPLTGYSYWAYDLTRAVLNGSVPVDRINDMATRVLAAWYQMGQDESFPPTNFDTNSNSRVADLYPAAWPFSPSGVVNEFVQVQADHYLVARQVAQEAVTLLKNNGSLLPITTSTPIKIFGTGAQTNPDGPNACADRSCNKGTLGIGWGSGTVNYEYMDDPLSAFKNRSSNVVYYNTDSFPSVPAPTADDVAFVFISSDSGENSYTVEGNAGDRSSTGLNAYYNGDQLVKDAAAKYQNVVVVIHTVGPVLVDEWIDLPSVKSVLVAHLPGQEAGESLASIIFGEASPSGHLPYSMTKQESDLPDSVTKLLSVQLFGQPQDTYTEKLYIDYRYLNKNGIKPRFAFGHGLSYTTFSYSNATISSVTPLTATPPARPVKEGILDYDGPIPAWTEGVAPSGFNKIFRYIYSWCTESEAKDAVAASTTKTYPYPEGYSTTQKPGPPAGGGEGGNPALFDVAFTVSVQVTNMGAQYSGKASAQAYVQFPDGGPDTPVIQLRDFEKTANLAPGESTTVTLELTRRDLSIWDVVSQNWIVPNPTGRYKIWVGEASDKLFLACYTDSGNCEEGLPSPV
ncbi:glycosyl hydrolase family 3 N terminal domain-containing protein [Colletotrichum graminicola M1.001]|uniref:beta-glucosidase n=1 Tax=Colletotrichum graminicola (strain M1.001 / M2 / FGSC 10212) TaxID=645133 RepID=E3QFP3_COLGM|nr:glycosyl hydrolase family 3 N terminal domain-containing protein [Colletotrichum graminicola M1.001]EFQ29728.1 glycosyl hydrolase family 3 N terminal domain-containing protein [Colletotrichum graminicola M1.001]